MHVYLSLKILTEENNVWDEDTGLFPPEQK
jgi:hypothetical protein